MGTMQIESIKVILLKVQAARGTSEAAPTEVDVFECEAGASIDIDYRVKDIDLVGSPQNQSIIGPRECSLSMALPMRTGALEGNALQVGKALMASFMKMTDSDTDADSTKDRLIYNPSLKDSEWKDYTCWLYSGSQDTSLSLLTKIQNCMFGSKIVLDFDNAYASLRLEGKGVLVGTPALGTQPTITPSTVVTPGLIGATISFFSDADYIPISIEFDIGPDIVATLKPTVASGLGITCPGSKRKIKWTAKVYHDSGIIPHTPLEAGTLGTISVAWGSTPNKFTVSTTKAQITSVKHSEQNNVSCFDLAGICVDNDFAVQIDTVVGA